MTDGPILFSGEVVDVSAYPLPDGLEDGLLNKSQLALAFNTSEPTIGKWLTAGLPVFQGGSNGVAYQFQLSDCWAWKSHRDKTLKAERDRSDRIASQAALAFGNLGSDASEEERAMTPQELRQWSEAHYHRQRVAEQRGELVRVPRVAKLIEDLLLQVRTGITTLPDFAEREFGLDRHQLQKLQDRCDDQLEELQGLIKREVLGGADVVAMAGLDDQAELSV